VLLAEGTVRAARRWLHLLACSSFDQAAAIIKADPAAAELTQTQYAAAIDWLRMAGLIVPTEYGPSLAPLLRDKAVQALDSQLFQAVVEQGDPLWLAEADTLILTPEDLPGDIVDLADALNLPEVQAVLGIRHVHGKIDLAERTRVGAAGERELAALLEMTWPGSVAHRALEDDGLGYDLDFTCCGTTWHLEVKSTIRRGRLAVYLSRNEHVVAELDPAWRLVVVGLDEKEQIEALATADTETVLSRAPVDQHASTRWESARHILSTRDLEAGLSYLPQEVLSAAPPQIAGTASQTKFDWMPSASPLL
jgi:hypothetical protein